MIRRSRFSAWLVLFCTVIFSAAAVAQPQAATTQKDAAQEKEKEKDKISNTTSHAQPADVSGDWQISWQVRLGSESGTLHFQQNGTKLTGAFKDVHGLSSVSGTVDETRISFDVVFQGKYPFSTRFTGNLASGKLEGTSQAIDVKGEGGAFLGHGGEVVHPEHPWTATRVTVDPARSSETSSAAAHPVKK